MKIINIPNIITCLNLISGCMAIYFGFMGNIGLACLCIVLGAVFDFFDGMTARALGVSGPIGKELDSLADVVSFGVAPAVLAYQVTQYFNGGVPNPYDFIIAMLIAAFSALRLAKFNCDDRQTSSFIGLPTPANALFWIGITYVIRIDGISDYLLNAAELSYSIWGVLVLCSCYLLISEIPMFSFKFKKGHTGWTENKLRYSFLIAAIAIIAIFAVIAQLPACLAVIILLYIIISIATR